MQELQSSLTNKRFEKQFVEDFLHPYGFTVGGGWDYDHGYFDYVFRKKPFYDVLRIPVSVKTGDFEQPTALVEWGTPLVLRHKYQFGIEDEQDSVFGMGAGPLNQFQKPIEKDAEVDQTLIKKGEEIIRQLESDISNYLH